MISRMRLTFMLTAVVAVATAAILWLSDGAWQYGTMPTKGVIRVALFGGAGCLCLAVAQYLSPSNDTKV